MKYNKLIRLHRKLFKILKIINPANTKIKIIKGQKLMIYMISIFIPSDIII